MSIGPQFSVHGSDIYLDNHHVAAILPHVWPTQADHVAALLETAQEGAISEDEHEEAIKALEQYHDKERDEWEAEKRELELAALRLEDENDALQIRCNEYERDMGVLDAMAQLRAELERETARNAEFREELRKARNEVAALKLAKKTATAKQRSAKGK